MTSSSYSGETFADHVSVPQCLRDEGQEVAEHYAGQVEKLFWFEMSSYTTEPGYWRHCADVWSVDSHGSRGYPHPSDCEPEATIEDFLEEADKCECGFVGGEEMV